MNFEEWWNRIGMLLYSNVHKNFINEIMYQAIQPKWHRINGRNPQPAPEQNKPVLVYACGLIEQPMIAAWTGRGWSLYYPWDVAHKDGDEFKYWMPLPESPK